MTDIYPTPTDSPFNDIEQYIPLVLTAIEAELTNPEVWDEPDRETALAYIQELIRYFIIWTPDMNKNPLFKVDLFARFFGCKFGTYTFFAAGFVPFGYVMFTDTTINREISTSFWLPAGHYTWRGIYAKNTSSGIVDVSININETNTDIVLSDNLDLYGTFNAHFLINGTVDIPVDSPIVLKINNNGTKNAASTGYSIGWGYFGFERAGDI